MAVLTFFKSHGPIISSLKVTYLWFLAIVVLFTFLLAILVIQQPVTLDYELAFSAPSDENWTIHELESQLRDISDLIDIVSGETQPEHEADYVIKWSRMAKRSDIGSDPLGPPIRAALYEVNPREVQGLRVNMGRVNEGEHPLRPTSPTIWLPFTILLLVFFYWQQQKKNAIAPPNSDLISSKAIAIALTVGVPLAPAIGMLIAWVSPESAARIPSVSFSLGNWPALMTLIILIPLAEEIVFRGWLLDRFSQVMAPSLALLISAAAFSAIHPMGLVANLIFLIPGFVWGYLWLRYRSLLVCTIAHASYNATVITIDSIQRL